MRSKLGVKEATVKTGLGREGCRYLGNGELPEAVKDLILEEIRSSS